MAIHLITGPVSVGKQNFAENTRKIMEKMGRKVLVASISDTMGRYGSRFGTNAQPMKETIQRAVREGVLEKFMVDEIAHKLVKEDYDDVVATLPLSIMNSHGAIEYVTPIGSIEKILEILSAKFNQPPGYFICMIDDPRRILNTMKVGNESAYASSIIQLLEWTSMEVVCTEQTANQVAGGRWLTLPVSYSETSLAKAVYDISQKRKSKVAYVAHPISEIIKYENSEDPKQKEFAYQCRKKIEGFKNVLQDHRIVISPIELAELKTQLEQDSLFGKLMEEARKNAVKEAKELAAKTGGKAEDFIESMMKVVGKSVETAVNGMLREHTIYRDLYWFVRMGEVIAYYPHSFYSPGAENEITEAVSLGKKVLFVKDRVPGGTEDNAQGGAKESPFAFEKRLNEKNIFDSPDLFLAQDKPYYAEVQKAWEEIRPGK